MNILIFGSGAIGSLFGALLSENSNVILYGRRAHIEAIKKKGLNIKGKTIFNKKLNAFYNTKNIERNIDLIILTVKSYDTNKSIKIIENIINKKTIIMTLQNGLDNAEKINKQFILIIYIYGKKNFHHFYYNFFYIYIYIYVQFI